MARAIDGPSSSARGSVLVGRFGSTASWCLAACRRSRLQGGARSSILISARSERRAMCCARCSRREMRGIDALGDVAQMVDVHSWGDWFDHRLVDVAMREPVARLPTIAEEPAVAVVHLAGPYPVAVAPRDQTPEAFNLGRAHSRHRIARRGSHCGTRW